MVTADAAQHASSVIFGWDPMITATIVLVVAYLFIFTERINRAVVSLLGAGLMIFLGVINQTQAVSGIDFNTIFLLIGMMAIVGITRKSGIFEYVAIKAAKMVRGNPRLLMIALALVTAVFSALLDNVTTVMLVVPVTLLLAEQLKLPAYPFLFSQIFASNIGGMSTLIGDPPNILIGSAVGLSFTDFLVHTGPIALILMILLIVFFDLFWGRKFKTTLRDRAQLTLYKTDALITDKPLLIKSIFVLMLVIFGFIVGHGYGYEPGTVALTGAALLMLLDIYKYKPEKQSHKVHDVLSKVEWETIFFFIGLFIIVYGVEHTGLLSMMGAKLLEITDGDMAYTGMLILGASAVLSAIVDNIPFVATMIPLIEATEGAFGDGVSIEPLWWCLSLGACLGGNGSLVGASANLMVASYAERAGQRIPFIKFLALGFPLMLVTAAIAGVYAYVRYFM